MLDIKKRRLEKKLTQGDVANAVGIARAAYANIELGVRRPSVKVAKKIATMLSFDWTLFYEDAS